VIVADVVVTEPELMEEITGATAGVEKV